MRKRCFSNLYNHREIKIMLKRRLRGQEIEKKLKDGIILTLYISMFMKICI
jgi:hypothetical protein